MQTSWQGLDEALAVWLGAAEFKCMGRTLRPFTLSHRELLRLAGHPLAHTGEANLVQLELAARICALRPRDAARLLRKRVGFFGRWWFALRAIKWGPRLTKEIEAFDAYITACSTQPEIMTGEEEQGAPKREVPALLDVIVQLSGEGFDMEQVTHEWPVGLAEWIYLTSVSKTANMKFVTDEDREMHAFLRAKFDQEAQRATELEEEDRSSGMTRAQRVLRSVLGRN